MARTVDKMLLEMVIENNKAIKNINKVQKKSDKFEKDSKKGLKRISAGWALLSTAIGSVVVLGFKKLVNAASRAQETLSKFNTVFSDIKKEANDAAQNLERNFGLSGRAAKQLLSDTGDLLTGFGFTQESALDLSKQVNELAVDLASFTNFSGGAEGASAALTKALLGERESVKALGISILDVDVKARVLTNTHNGLRFATERQAKAYATLQIAQEQSKNAQGDFARTSKDFANQIRIVRANIENWAVSMGSKLLPIFAPFIKTLNRVLTPARDIEDITQDLIKSQTTYKEIVDKLSDSQLNLSKSERQVLQIRRDLEKLNIIKELNELNKAYDLQVVAVEKAEKVSIIYSSALDSLRNKIADYKKETIELTAEEIRLTGVTAEMVDGFDRSGKGIANTADVLDVFLDKQDKTGDAIKKTTDAQDLLNGAVDKYAQILIDGNLAESDLIGLNEELFTQITERVPLLEAENELNRIAAEEAAAEEVLKAERVEAEKVRIAELNEAKKIADDAEKARVAERKKLIADILKFQVDSEKELTTETNKELQTRLKAYKAVEITRAELSKTFVDGFLGGIESMKSSSKDVLVSMIKSFVSMIAGRLAALSAFYFASLNIPAGIAALAAAGTVKALGGSAANAIASAEQGMDSAPGGSVLVGEAGPEVVNIPKGSQIIPNHKINMSRFNTIPAFQNGTTGAGDMITNSGGNVFVERVELTPETPEDFRDKLMEFGESVNVDFVNP